MISPNEADRLRALFALMREFGVAKLAAPDGYTIERPVSPLDALANEPAAAKPDPLDKENARIEREADEERELEQRWNAYWTRMTASSGSPAPRFPGAEKAASFLGKWS